MQPMNKEYPYLTPAGRRNAYGLICGYGEHKVINGVDVNLWLDGCYHVRAHEHGGRGRLFWESFPTLTQARRFYDRAKKTIREAEATLRAREQARLIDIAVKREIISARVYANKKTYEAWCRY